MITAVFISADGAIAIRTLDHPVLEVRLECRRQPRVLTNAEREAWASSPSAPSKIRVYEHAGKGGVLKGCDWPDWIKEEFADHPVLAEMAEQMRALPWYVERL